MHAERPHLHAAILGQIGTLKPEPTITLIGICLSLVATQKSRIFIYFCVFNNQRLYNYFYEKDHLVFDFEFKYDLSHFSIELIFFVPMMMYQTSQQNNTS